MSRPSDLTSLIAGVCKNDQTIDEKTMTLVHLKKLMTRAYSSDLPSMVNQVMHQQRTVISLIHLMEHEDPGVRSAAISLTSQLSLTHSQELLTTGSIGACTRLLSSCDKMLSVSSMSEIVFILGHAVSASPQVMSEPHGGRILSATAALLSSPSPASTQLERSIIWLASCVCTALRAMSDDQVEQISATDMIPVIFSMIPHLIRRLSHRDREIMCDTCRSLTGLVKFGGNAVVFSVLPASETLVVLAEHQEPAVATSSLRLIGSMIALSNNGQVQKLMDASLLKTCHKLLTTSSSQEIKRDVCWIASNCAAERVHISRMSECGLLKSISDLLSTDPDCGVRREAAYCISHVAQCGEMPIVRLMCESMNVIESLIRCLEFRDTRLILRILSGLGSILQVGCDIARHKGPAGNEFSDRMQLAGGLDRLMILQSDPEERIACKADALIRTFFPVARETTTQCSTMWFHVARVDHLLMAAHRSAAEAAKRKRDHDR